MNKILIRIINTLNNTGRNPNIFNKTISFAHEIKFSNFPKLSFPYYCDFNDRFIQNLVFK